MSGDLCLFVPMLLIPFRADTAARLFAQDVAAAIDAALTRKEAATVMGIREALLSEWLAASRPLNAFRLLALPAAFWNELLKRLARRRGGAYLEPEVVTLLKGAAEMKRPMLSMTLLDIAERDIA